MALEINCVDESNLAERGGTEAKSLREPLKRKVKGLRLRQDENLKVCGQQIVEGPGKGKLKTSQSLTRKVLQKSPVLVNRKIVVQNAVADADIQEGSKLEANVSKSPRKVGGNPQLVEEYRMETRKYLEQRELLPELQVSDKYLEGQTKVLPVMRALVVDWMAGVVLQLSLHPETLQLAVVCLDRFLQAEVNNVGKEKLQLTGATSLLIAAKYEETYPPEIAEICYLSGGGVLETELRETEAWMLNCLDFNLGLPLPQQFLRWARFAEPTLVKKDVYCLSQYFTELSLVDYNLAGVRASVRAAAAVALATKLLVNFSDEGCLESKVLTVTGHSLVELSPVLQQMSRLVMVAPTNRTLLTAFRKFSSEKFLCVARSPLLASHFVTSSANHRKDT